VEGDDRACARGVAIGVEHGRALVFGGLVAKHLVAPKPQNPNLIKIKNFNF